MSEAITTIDLMRHGEPIGGQRYRGALDDPLSERGWEQMRTVIGGRCPWDAVLSSPLIRCAAFARELSERRGLPLEIVSGLREIGFGAWEGRSVAEVEVEQPQALRRFWQDPVKHPPPGGESLLAFHARILAAWDELLARYHGRHFLLVCHGGAIRVLLSHFLEIPLNRIWRLAVPYAAVSRVCIYGHGVEAETQLMFHAGRLE